MEETTKTITPATAPKVVKRVQKKSNTPTTDINLAAVAVRVAAKWSDYPHISLMHTTQTDFAATAAQFNDFIQQRVDEMNTRPTMTRSIKELTADIKLGLKMVRGYLLEKYEDEKLAMSYYPDFGLEKKGTAWVFPADQQRALSALKAIKKGLVTHGFGSKKFGTTKFTQLETDYTNAVNTAVINDGMASATVSNKEVMKKNIKMVLISIRFAIRAHYPDTYTGILRDFGFQKEKV